MSRTDIFRTFNVSPESEDIIVEESYRELIKKTISNTEKLELLEKFHLIDTKEKRYLYFLTLEKGFDNLSELNNEIISRPNYVGPGQWLELLE